MSRASSWYVCYFDFSSYSRRFLLISAPWSEPGQFIIIFDFFCRVMTSCLFNFCPWLDCSQHAIKNSDKWLTVLFRFLRHYNDFELILLNKTFNIANRLGIGNLIVEVKNVLCPIKSWTDGDRSSNGIEFKLGIDHPLPKWHYLITANTDCAFKRSHKLKYRVKSIINWFLVRKWSFL